MSLATGPNERAAPDGEGMPRRDAVDIDKFQRDIESRLTMMDEQENALRVFAVALLLGGLFAALANGFLVVLQEVGNKEPPSAARDVLRAEGPGAAK